MLALVLVAGCAEQQPEKRQTATTAPEGPAAGGGVTPEENDAIEAIFRRKTANLMTCWQDEYERTHDRKLEGDVTIGMTVTTGGKASDVRVLHSSLGNAEIEGCVVKEISTWGFPEMTASCPYRRTIHLGAQF
jgi:hypothetical protein